MSRTYEIKDDQDRLKYRIEMFLQGNAIITAYHYHGNHENLSKIDTVFMEGFALNYLIFKMVKDLGIADMIKEDNDWDD